MSDRDAVIAVLPHTIVAAYNEIMRPENADRYFGGNPHRVDMAGRLPGGCEVVSSADLREVEAVLKEALPVMLQMIEQQMQAARETGAVMPEMDARVDALRAQIAAFTTNERGQNDPR